MGNKKSGNYSFISNYPIPFEVPGGFEPPYAVLQTAD